jgi:hypothetical protein
MGSEGGLDETIAAMATVQHGVVARWQLLEAGATARQIHRRLMAGRLRLLHRGVYAVGHEALTRRSRYMAAVLAVGPGAALSHGSAADLLGLLGDSRTTIDVSSVIHRHSRRGIRVHRTPSLSDDEVTTAGAIACTDVTRTLNDIAAVVGERQLERAVRQADFQRTLDWERAGRKVRDAAGIEDDRALDGVEAEFLALVRAAGLPEPLVNEPFTLPDFTEARLDFVWHAHRLVVETDGRAAHGTDLALERDRHRDLQLRLAGYDVLRFTRRQVRRSPGEVAAVLAARLR